MSDLTGKTALVTGASRGIGRAIAQRLAADGATVAVHYGREAAAAEQTVKAITDAGGHAFPVRAEFGRPGDIDTLFAALDATLAERGASPELDILVNNAAIGLPATIDEVSAEAFDKVFAVNARAPFFLVQRALPRLRDGGRIVNISSGVTRIALPEIIAYSMTKGALDVFTKTLAKAVGPRGITVNVVAPGFVHTDATTDMLSDPAMHAYATDSSALGRIGEPADIADTVAFLASDDGRWLTGAWLDATGGSHL